LHFFVKFKRMLYACVFFLILVFLVFFIIRNESVSELDAGRLPAQVGSLFEGNWTHICFHPQYEIPLEDGLGSSSFQCWGTIEVPFGHTYISTHFTDGRCRRYKIAMDFLSSDRSSSLCIDRESIVSSRLDFENQVLILGEEE